MLNSTPAVNGALGIVIRTAFSGPLARVAPRAESSALGAIIP